jgi:predicted glycoside hydrolase/deacetylase ChbG (UPF0249 family)
LIVNADDFGFSNGINRGIVEAHERGIVTSASLMVEQPGAEDAAVYAQQHPELSLGLHLELPRARRFLRRNAHSGTRAEVRRQLDRFRRLLDRDPTHVDSHRHRHRSEPARSVVLELGLELAVPVRDFHPLIRHCGYFYGQRYGSIYSTKPNPAAISVQALVSLLENLAPGVTELCCHPGFAEDLRPTFRKEPYRAERALEVSTLCAPEVRSTIERLRIRLCSFREVSAVRESPQPTR